MATATDTRTSKPNVLADSAGANGLLAIPDAFRKTALAFPDAVKSHIALLSDPEVAANELAKSQVMANYGRQIKATTEEVNSVQYGKLLLAAKVGELCPAEKRGPKPKGVNHPPGEKLFHANTLTDYRKLAKHQREARRIDEYWEAVAESGHESEMSISGFLGFVGSDGNLKSAQNKGVIEWYTPKEYIEPCRQALGGIDLDPASCAKANRIVKAERYYSKTDDGLAQDWAGNVFLNPPFQAKLISKFVAKLCESYTDGDVEQAVLLTNNNTDTRWWHQAAELSAAICFTLGRVPFYNPAGEEAAPTNGHNFFYFGSTPERFVELFSSTIGIVWH